MLSRFRAPAHSDPKAPAAVRRGRQRHPALPSDDQVLKTFPWPSQEDRPKTGPKDALFDATTVNDCQVMPGHARF